MYEFGPFRLEPAPGLRLTRDGKEVTLPTKDGKKKPLTGKAFEVLLTFVKRYDEVVTKRVLEVEVWEGDEKDSRVITQNVRTIRKFLSDNANAPEYIKTVPGQGYRFIKPVREVHKEKDKGAEELYIDGLAHFYTFNTEAELNKAISCFKQAYTNQPDYAPAFAAASEAHIWLSLFSWQDPAQAMPKAKRLADEALRLDSTLGDAQATYALAELIWRRNWTQAQKVFERVLKQNPTSQPALRGYALWLMANARFDDALRKIDRALAMSSKSFLNIGIKCMVLYASGVDLDPFGQSLETAHPQHRRKHLIHDFMMQVTEEQRVLKVDAAWYVRGLFYERLGWSEQAIKIMAEIELTDEQFLGNLVLAHIYAVAGHGKKALELLDRLKMLKRWVSPFHIALIELALGNRDDAKRCLKDAIRKHDPWSCLLIDPRLKDLRDDPEFLGMFHRINLDPNLIHKVELKGSENSNND